MALQRVGVRFIAENLSGYTSALAQAERANDRFKASVTGISSQSNFGQLGRGIQRESGTIRTGFAQAGQAATSFGRTVVSAAGVATAALAGIGAAAAVSFGRAAIDTRIGFDAAISNVGALARANDEELVRLTSTAEQLGRTTSFSATQAAEALSFTSLAGFSVDESIQALPGILSVAAAAQSDLGETSDIVTNALSGFRLEASEAGRVGDVLTAGFTGSNTSLEQLGTALSFAAPGAEALGLSIEETTAAIGLFSNAGIQGTRAGTALRGILNRLNAPTGEAEERLRELGISAFDSQGQFVGLANVLDQFDSALEPLSDQARGEALNTIFGAVAATPFTAILAAGSDELRTLTAEIENATGLSGQVSDQQLDNLAGDITRARSAYEGLQLAVTRRATPALRGFFNNAIIPGLTATTNFVEGLNDGRGALESFAIGLSSLGSEAFQLEDDLFTVDFGDLIDLTFDFSSAAGQFALLGDFITGAIDLGIGDARQEINIADFITFTSDAGATQFNIGEFFDFTSDAEGVEINVADFITFSSQEIETSLQGVFENVTKIRIGDLFDFSSTSFGDALTGATFGITKLKIGDIIDLTGTSGELGSAININDVIIGTYDLLSNITKLRIGDVFTGALNLTTGEGSVKIGDDLEFEFDLSNLQSQIQSQLTSLQASILGSAAVVEGGIELAPATQGLVSRIQSGITSALSGEFTLELPEGFSFALPEGFAAEDLLSVTGGLDSLGESLSSLDSFLTTETGDAGALASFVTSFNESISGLAESVRQADGEAIGESVTGVVTSIIGIFTTLNTIDDLALGGIAGTVGDLVTSLLGFATDVTTGLDADTIGQAAAQGAADFVSSFSAVITEPDLPEIAGAAAGFAAAIATQFRNAFTSDNLSEVGGAIGVLVTDIITQLTNTLSNPDFGSQLGQGFADLLIGITQGLTGLFSGISSAVEESTQGEPLVEGVSNALGNFAENFVSAAGEALREADYSSLAQDFLTGIQSAIQAAFGDFTGQDLIDLVLGRTLAREGGGAIPLTPEQIEQQESSLLTRELRPFSDSDLFGRGGQIELSDEQVASRDDSVLTRELFPQPQLPQFITDAFSGFFPSEEPDLSFVEEQREAQRGLSESATTLTDTATTLAEAGTTASDAAETAQQSWLNFLSGGLLDVENAGEAQRTGLGTGAAFDEVDIAGSVQDQILTQLNFGDLPDQISTAATDAIATAIPSEPIIDSEAVNTALLTAAQEAIPPETVIDTETVNTTLLAAAQEAIPPTSVPEFPGWESIIEVRVPRIPRFPTWRQVANFRIPSIPSFPGWSTFISFDIPSIPSFPGWDRFVGGIDIAATLPPFPGWAALLGGSVPSAPSSNIPEFQTGSESVQRTGVALVGEQGPELRLINQGDRIFPASVTSRILDTARSIASRMPTINSDPNAVLGATTNLIAQTNVNSVGVTIDGGGAEPSGFDVVGLAIGIVDAFATAFSVPSFPGWDTLFDVSPIRIPRFPGWTNIVGLDDISVQILRTDDGSEIVDDDDDGGGREFTGGIELPRPETPPGFGFPTFAADTPRSPQLIRPVPPPITSSPIPRPPSIPSLPPVIIPRRPSGGQETGEGLGGPVLSSSLTESNMIVNQPINNTNINLVRNFNLTTNSLRSSESISNDFVLMERLAAVGGIA